MNIKTINSNQFRNFDYPKFPFSEYYRKIQSLEKSDLLKEMIQFQAKRSEHYHLAYQMVLQGQILFQAIEEKAVSTVLKKFAHAYHKNLKLELKMILYLH